ncbi:protein MOTHER of FT and TFL1 isoform X2 [Helianthus annuus]|uniref:protein MOTHER of FT and TFL1 isoform X2 n=1 Tax=Helianthus annuus TaxID=4232 RepID=UPI000B9019CF|nr:protein MOTHER of FT and TFL1 isoform X2 [Helianthus annuus]
MDPRAYFDVINDVVGNFMDPFVPTVTVTAYFGDHRLTNCSELRLATAQIAPRVVIGGNQDELYTLIMVDPDAPNPNEPSSREVVLWIVTNIPGGTSTAEGKHHRSMRLKHFHRVIASKAMSSLRSTTLEHRSGSLTSMSEGKQEGMLKDDSLVMLQTYVE